MVETLLRDARHGNEEHLDAPVVDEPEIRVHLHSRNSEPYQHGYQDGGHRGLQIRRSVTRPTTKSDFFYKQKKNRPSTTPLRMAEWREGGQRLTRGTETEVAAGSNWV